MRIGLLPLYQNQYNRNLTLRSAIVPRSTPTANIGASWMLRGAHNVFGIAGRVFVAGRGMAVVQRQDVSRMAATDLYGLPNGGNFIFTSFRRLGKLGNRLSNFTPLLMEESSPND